MHLHLFSISRGSILVLVLLVAGRVLGADAGSKGATPPAPAAFAEVILHNGNVAIVDSGFSLHQAVALADGRILETGGDAEVLRRRGPGTEMVDLRGRLVLPGLMDSHVHSADACLTEFDHPIPEMDSVSEVLDYIRGRARVVPEGEWIEVRQVFITRLREQRYPTRAELDRAAPRHPCIFATGPDASLNSLALQRSGLDRNFKVTDGGSGFAEKDPQTGELTGLLRNCSRYVKVQSTKRRPSSAEKIERLRELFADYNAVGLTCVGDRDAGVDDLETYEGLRAAGRQTVRVRLSHHIESIGPGVEDNIRRVAQHRLFREGDDWLRLIGIKTFLDGGMLTGSAYMRAPWGVSKIYGITDPQYRGVLFIPPDRLRGMVRATVESGLQFTAHSVGDGAVHTLLDVYGELHRESPAALRRTAPCISHANFLSREAVAQAAEFGVMLDMQPAWLYLDARTLARQFGEERLRWFQPLHSLFAAGAVAGGGSDHMQKIGARRSINPYDPFLGMATAITRRARRFSGQLHGEEALSRTEAIRFYTINNARILRCDDRLGSLEAGKLADLIVVDTDLLTCPERKIAETQVLRTYVGGRLVYQRDRSR
jgi:predicted amidohydrolase YtcJ